MKSGKKFIGVGVVTAFASSLCCITPVLALVAGSSGLASTFSWLEPLRPYLIGASVIVLGFAWWQKLLPAGRQGKPQKADEIDCDCDDDEKPSFWQSKKFLGIVTVFAALMLVFPYYAHVFYPNTTSDTIIVESENVIQAEFKVDGMTCTGCEEHIKHAVSEIPGFIEVSASYEEGKVSVKFDKSKSSLEDVIKVINETGYKVTDHKIIE